MISYFKKIKVKIFTQPKTLKKIKLSRPKYYNIHKNKKALILATGPSIELYKEKLKDFIDNNNLILIGTNNSYKFFNSQYYVYTNRKRLLENLPYLPLDGKLIASAYIREKEIEADYKKEYWKLFYDKSRRNEFSIKSGIILSECGSVALAAVGVALVMGFTEIYLAGLDGYSDLFKEGKKINCANVKTKYSDEKKDKTHYMKLQEKNDFYLDKIFSSLSKEFTLKIITPTVHLKYFDPTILKVK